MTPLYFGTGERRLFGVLDAAQARPGQAQAAVICYPWGPEYIFAHRALRYLARQLAAGGFTVLRFDYYGSGDSAGSEAEARLSGWREDIISAIEEIKDICHVKAIALIGLRLGGSLAAQIAASSRKDVSALVLWDAAVSGPEHLEVLEIEWTEMAQRHCTYLGDKSERKRGARFGLPISEALAADMNAIDLLNVADRLPSRTLCLSTERLASHAAWRAVLGTHPNGPIALEELPDIHPWVEADLETIGRLPLAAIDRITGWLAT